MICVPCASPKGNAKEEGRNGRDQDGTANTLSVRSRRMCSCIPREPYLWEYARLAKLVYGYNRAVRDECIRYATKFEGRVHRRYQPDWWMDRIQRFCMKRIDVLEVKFVPVKIGEIHTSILRIKDSTEMRWFPREDV